MRKEKWAELRQYIEELKVISIEKQEKDSKFIRSVVYNCALNNGKVITREKLLKGGNNGSAVIVLPLTTSKEVILTVEPRVFTERTVGIGVPAGYIEKGEDGETAALRELKEETGCVPEKLIFLGGFYQDTGCSAAFNECYLALNCKKIAEQHLDVGEYIRYFECSLEEALELQELGYIQGCNDIIILDKVKRRREEYV